MPATDERSVVQPPTLLVIAGPNGAGKTTFAKKLLPRYENCREFLNADLIAYGLSPLNPERQALTAGRLLLSRMKELSDARETFGLETTLAGKTYFRHFQELSAIGYHLVLYYLWIPSGEYASERVSQRVRQGGHNVPDADVRRRYVAGLKNAFGLYRPLFHEWLVFDSSKDPPCRVATEEAGNLVLHDPDRYDQIIKGIGE